MAESSSARSGAARLAVASSYAITPLQWRRTRSDTLHTLQREKLAELLATLVDLQSIEDERDALKQLGVGISALEEFSLVAPDDLRLLAGVSWLV